MRRLIPQSFPFAGLMLWVAGLIPCAISSAYLFGSGDPHPMETPPRLQSLVFDEYVLDFRGIKQSPRDVHYFYFAFRNTGDRELKITSLDGSCGCLQPIVTGKDSKVFLPGETGEILLRVHSASQDPGEREYWVDVNYEDPAPHERRITLKLDLPKEQVWIRPKGLVFYPGRSGIEIPPQEVSITDFRSQPLRIIGSSCDNPYIEIEPVTAESASSSPEIVGKIRVTLKTPVPEGKQQATVKVFTDDPEQRYQELRVPIIINTPSETADRHVSNATD